jgi:hypothetical protein
LWISGHCILRLSTLLICFFFIVSCQSIIRKEPCVDSPGSSEKAAEFISTLTNRSDSDISIKGIGKVALWDSGGIQTSRAAWAGIADGRMRIEMLGLPGHPIAKFIYDGQDYVFVSPLDQRTYRKHGADADLDSLTGIPIPTAEVIKLLSGVVPVRPFDEAAFQNGETQCKDILVLNRKWHGVVEKLFLNDTHDRVVKVEMYRWGRIVYRATLEDLQVVEGREVPFRLVFSNANQKGFSIEVEKCWPDIDVSSDIFSIETLDHHD